MNREDSVHPAAEIFPLIEGEAFDELVADIEVNGLREPILRMSDGRILDGRNRYRACLVAEVEPRSIAYGGTDPWGEVVSRNLYRRHLTDAQRAVVAARLAERANGVRGPSKQKGGSSAPPSRDLPPTQGQAERLLGVSHGSVKRARAVVTQGTPDLVAAAEAGHIPLARAERIAKELPKEEQDAYVAEVKSRPSPPAPSPTARTAPTKPAAAKPAAPRRPITDQAMLAGHDLRKAIDRVTRVLDDEHYPRNREQVTRALRGHLLHTIEAGGAALDRLSAHSNTSEG